jgi:amino acid transporter
MLSKLLNDAREGHYFWMRKKNSPEVAKIANFGIIFFTLFIFYISLLIFIAAIEYIFTNQFQGYRKFVTNAPLFFSCYLLVYFIFINPRIKKGEINENISEIDRKRKNRVATIWFTCSVASLPLAILVMTFLRKIL